MSCFYEIRVVLNIGDSPIRAVKHSLPNKSTTLANKEDNIGYRKYNYSEVVEGGVNSPVI